MQTSKRQLITPNITRVRDLEWQHGDPDHPKDVNCPVFHHRANLKLSSKSANIVLSNCLIFDLKVSMVIQNQILCSFYHTGPLNKMSLQSVYDFLSNPALQQKDKPNLPKT